MINLLKKYRTYSNKVIKMAFTCNYCSTIFSEKRNLKRHINSKREATNLRCEKCEFTTNRKDKLKTHIESKHYQNKIKCSECSVEFSRKDSMEKHRKIYHPQDPSVLMEDRSTPTVVTPTPEQASDTEVFAFNKRLVEKKWYIEEEKDILKVFTNYRETKFTERVDSLRIKLRDLEEDILALKRHTFIKHNTLKECKSSFVVYVIEKDVGAWKYILTKHLQIHRLEKKISIFKIGTLTVTFYESPNIDSRSKIHIQSKDQVKNQDFIFDVMPSLYQEVAKTTELEQSTQITKWQKEFLP